MCWGGGNTSEATQLIRADHLWCLLPIVHYHASSSTRWVEGHTVIRRVILWVVSAEGIARNQTRLAAGGWFMGGGHRSDYEIWSGGRWWWWGVVSAFPQGLLSDENMVTD